MDCNWPLASPLHHVVHAREFSLFLLVNLAINTTLEQWWCCNEWLYSSFTGVFWTCWYPWWPLPNIRLLVGHLLLAKTFWYWLGDIFGFLNGIFAHYLESQNRGIYTQCTKYASALVLYLTFNTGILTIKLKPWRLHFLSTGMQFIQKMFKHAVLTQLG